MVEYVTAPERNAAHRRRYLPRQQIGVCKAEERMIKTCPETLDKRRWLVRLYPGVNAGRALDSGGLDPSGIAVFGF